MACRDSVSATAELADQSGQETPTIWPLRVRRIRSNIRAALAPLSELGVVRVDVLEQQVAGSREPINGALVGSCLIVTG